MGFSQSTAQNLQKNMVEFVTFDYIDGRSSAFLTFLCYFILCYSESIKLQCICLSILADANINAYVIPLD